MSDKFEDNEIYPVEQSASGDNAYYLRSCDVVGHRPAYCACIRKVEDRKRGRLASVYSDCSAAIGKKQCEAQRMRKEELAEGRAIYFINRRKLAVFLQYEEEVGRQKFASMPLGKSKQPKRSSLESAAPPVPPVQKHFLDIGGSYADAINRALAVPNNPAVPAEEKPVEQPKVAPSVQLKPGMSLLELARLQLQAQAV